MQNISRASIVPAIIVLLSHVLINNGSEIAPASPHSIQKSVRIAIVGLVGPKADDSLRIEAALTEILNRDNRLALIDQSLVKLAIAGVGYDRSINMSKDEARRVGAAIGCEFFVIGKTEALTRSTRENESHEEAYAGVMIVDARTGSLAAFDFIVERGATREAALNALVKSLSASATGYAGRIEWFIESHAAGAQASFPAPAKDVALESPRSTNDEKIEAIPDEGSPRDAGFSPPVFLNRVKPEYTAQADAADITASVEAMVVLHSNGEVGSIDITRWAGFGLEQSAERAIRQLKFKAAVRDGKPVSVRALVRYNFRRVESETKPKQPARPRT